MLSYWQPSLRKNNADFSYGANASFSSGGTRLVEAEVGDFFELVAYWSNGGSAVTLAGGRAYSYFCGHLVGRT